MTFVSGQFAGEGDGVRRIGATLQAEDPGLAAHGTRVADLAAAVGQRMDLSQERLRRLRIACTLHDIGKVDVDQAVLFKPGPLEGEE